VTPREGGVRFAVRVKPRATRTEILGVREDALEIAVGAPPVDGAANEELVRAVAKLLSVSRRDVLVVAGQTGRQKVLEVRGLDAAAVLARLSGGKA
jgi:hypothetical protein